MNSSIAQTNESYLTFTQLDRNRVYRRSIRRVIRKWEARNLKENNVLMGEELLLLDEKENTIQCSVHHSLLQKYGNQLCEGNIIEICNFNVQSTNNKKYKVTSHPFSIRVTARTRIGSVGQEFCKISQEKFCLRTYPDLVQLQDVTDDLYDTIGYIVKVDKGDVRSRTTPTTTLRKVEVTLLLEQGIEVPVIIWAEQAELFEDKYRVIEDKNIVLIMTSVLVKLYQGALQFNASSSTKFYLNHDSNHVTEFRKRFKYDGGCSINLRTMIQHDKADEEQQSIGHIWDHVSSDNRMAKEFLCEATITEIVSRNGWNYISCSTCQKKLIKQETSLFCPKCDKSQAVGMLSFKIEIIVDDGRDYANLILWDPEASKLLGTTAEKIAVEDIEDASSDKEPTSVPTCVKSIVGKTYLFRIKVTETDFDALYQSFSVLKVIDKELKTRSEANECERKRQEREEQIATYLPKKLRTE